jgi:hypothetical protein
MNDAIRTHMRDPEQLYNLFLGGYSPGARREFEGLFSKVQRGLLESFSEYRPAMKTSSVMAMSTRKGHESYADVGALNTYLRDWIHEFGDVRPGKHRTWLEEHPPPDPPRVLLTKEDVGALLRMTKASTRHHIERLEVGLEDEDLVEGLLGLYGAFSHFLSEACTHGSKKRVGNALVCRGCGFTKVEVAIA